jgi:hypothetical protein
MKILKLLILLAILCAPTVVTLCSCDRKVEVKQSVTDDGQGNTTETTVRKFH